jgi:hypothetical protein
MPHDTVGIALTDTECSRACFPQFLRPSNPTSQKKKKKRERERERTTDQVQSKVIRRRTSAQEAYKCLCSSSPVIYVTCNSRHKHSLTGVAELKRKKKQNMSETSHNTGSAAQFLILLLWEHTDVGKRQKASVFREKRATPSLKTLLVPVVSRNLVTCKDYSEQFTPLPPYTKITITCTLLQV